MSRLVVLTLIVSLGSSPVAFAGETLAGVATRVTREVARNEAPVRAKSAATTSGEKNWAGRSLAASVLGVGLPSNALAQDQPALSSSGMRKRTKILIFIGVAAGFAAAAYAIDHKVEDNTPSTLGIRED